MDEPDAAGQRKDREHEQAEIIKGLLASAGLLVKETRTNRVMYEADGRVYLFEVREFQFT
jgi:hypothetical protein